MKRSVGAQDADHTAAIHSTAADERAIDWVAKLRHLLQTLAFCLAIAAMQYAVQPDRPYDVPLRYSLCIGLSIWALIDFGRHLFPSSRDTGWPAGIAGLLLPMGSIVLGYAVGTLLADWWVGLTSWADTSRTTLRASIIVTLLAGTVASFYFYSRGKSAYLERRIDEARFQAAQARLKLLESQLEPHMLFNTLANLRALIGTDPPRAQQMLDRLISFLRATLAGSRTTTHALREEFDRLRDYLALMSVRMGPRLTCTLDLPDELASQPVPSLLLQPLVENAIRHGLEPKVAGGSVRVSARHEDSWLVLEVLDDGSGLQPAATPRGGFGLTQVRERLATLYGERAALELTAAPDGGTRARIRIPYTT